MLVSSVQVLGAAAFGKGKGGVWSEEIQCRGSESQIHVCSRSSSQMHSCSHDNDVGVICSGYTDLRLVNSSDSCSGRVELQFLKEWGTVCDACWDMRAASVLCRQLNCGIAVSVVGSDWFGEGSDEIWADVFDCDGNETKLSECSISSWSRAECSHRRDVGVICSGSKAHQGNCSSSQTLNCSSTQHLSVKNFGRRSIRLVGSGGDCAGRLEVFHSGSWGTVCDDSWDIKDAHVVCRQLQCGVALSNQQVPAWFGPGSGPIWLDEVECEGNETSLWSCSSPGWGKHDCQHKEDVGVVCSEFKEIRLTEGCEGNVECRGNEIHLWDCPLSLNNHTDYLPDVSVSATPATTSSASPPVSPSVRSTSVTPPQTPPAASLSVPPVLVIVLGVVLLLLLVPLLILIQQNRVMRRALSKRRHRTTTEAVYEEIQHRHNHFTQRGSLISEELHSGYEDADDLLSAKEFKTAYYDDVTNDSSLKEEMLKEITPGYYDDVITDGLKPDRETEDTPESYDDVMTSGQNSDIKKVDTPENYDDVIINRRISQGVTERVQEEYDDVMSVSEDVRNLLDYDDVEEEVNKESVSMITPTASVQQI
ncbi:scavenger receptor cysteine-rich type 1 protein M130-like [Sinocyclocheilus rhinocerous]|uniref:scavenger receptor cysteine-rich type 1 protein M130-like n=1 Tax=Sinocyclocheilus rhinocerous TaxID=307959 RepID=UPI0007BA283F|nr:PREDICTED: scavenger receptor cysteine-rich type 1 protein M130-like [Sinocyclocheilus rhinocerous]